MKGIGRIHPRQSYNTHSGSIGELLLTKYLAKRGYHVLHDLNVPINRLPWDWRTTQIDAILIVPGQIYCIEVKHYAGFVRCGRYLTKTPWIQKKGRVLFRFFQSPLAQNDFHVRALKKHNPSSLPVKNIVVFTAGAEIKNKPENVMYLDELKRRLFLLHKPESLDAESYKAYKKFKRFI